MPSPGIFKRLRENLHRGGPGYTGAVVAFVIALLWVRFGFFKMLFVLLLTALGYYVGIRYFSDRETMKRYLDKLFPPGKFR